MLFNDIFDYSYIVFRQTILLYKETINNQKFDIFCQNVILKIIIHFEFVFLLRLIIKQKHVDAIIIICELRRV